MHNIIKDEFWLFEKHESICMSYLRSFIFNFIFWVLSPLWVLLVLVPVSFLKSPTPMRRCLLIWFNAVFFLLDKISDIQIEERGIENLPKDKGFILCCKHMSNLEALITYRRMPNLTALAKIELFRIFGFKQVLEKMEVIAIDRGKGEAKDKTPEIARILTEQKIPLLLFVEGTRIPVGKRKKLKSGVYYMQKDVDLPVICVSMNTGVHWVKGSVFNKPGTVVLEYHPAIERGLDKEEFMARVKENVVLHSEKLMGIEGSDE
ncbi:MAG: 1-acyl-sn-glycerol-3-phosphate acyltransferase [Emcibacter sp.]|nr:1-acyl-sn-glycerol-3-phosphate acyltransferase [Emcibacter sp.]